MIENEKIHEQIYEKHIASHDPKTRIISSVTNCKPSKGTLDILSLPMKQCQPENHHC